MMTLSLALVACGEAQTLGPGDVADVGPRDPGGLCPPMGTPGLELNQAVPDVALADCDGNPVSLHDLCPRKAAYFFVYADW